MIDWINVGFGALWIIGLSVILAALSITEYQRTTESISWRDALKRRGFQIAFNVGLMLFCFGWAGMTREVWEQVVWGLLGIAFAYYAWSASQIEHNKRDGS